MEKAIVAFKNLCPHSYVNTKCDSQKRKITPSIPCLLPGMGKQFVCQNRREFYEFRFLEQILVVHIPFVSMIKLQSWIILCRSPFQPMHVCFCIFEFLSTFHLLFCIFHLKVFWREVSPNSTIFVIFIT